MKQFMFPEMLESRVLLSTVQSGLIVLPQALPSSDVQGYTPAQIRHAYGFDQVADDGTGFDPELVAAARGVGGGLGLASMRERAVFAGGTLRVRSAPGSGTEIRLAVPAS